MQSSLVRQTGLRTQVIERVETFQHLLAIKDIPTLKFTHAGYIIMLEIGNEAMILMILDCYHSAEVQSLPGLRYLSNSARAQAPYQTRRLYTYCSVLIHAQSILQREQVGDTHGGRI